MSIPVGAGRGRPRGRAGRRPLSAWLRAAARRLLGRAAALLVETLFPADCFLCGGPLPFHQEGSACLPCWERIPWTPGIRFGGGPVRAVAWAAAYEGPLRRLIHGLKFEGMDYLGSILGARAAGRLLPLVAALPARPDVIVPVPLHWTRGLRRGYNQALLLARPLARATGIPLDPGLLARRRAGRRQLGLSRRERRASLEGCYRARGERGWRAGRRDPPLRGKTVMLVDDVLTTGATLEACARALVRAGASGVVACVLARTPRTARPASGPGPAALRR